MSELKEKVISITKKEKSRLVDIALLLVSIAMIIWATSAAMEELVDWRHYVLIPLLNTVVYLIVSSVLRLTKTMWEFANGRTFIKLLVAVLIMAVSCYFLTSLKMGASRWVFATYLCIFFVCFALLIISKLVILQVYDYEHRRANVTMAFKTTAKNTLIVGAGWTGTALAKEFINNPAIFVPVCFVDDSVEKRGKFVLDLPVVGGTDDIPKVVKKYNIKKIIFAIPSCDTETRTRILSICVATKCNLKVVPPIQELVEQAGEAPQTRDVRIEDLLGREPMVFDSANVRSFLCGKVVLVTGGGGSIGSELCRQIASFNPTRLIIMDLYENNAYDIQQELKMNFPTLDLRVEICSIADYDKCRILFERYRPQVVYHAAAHKHVPLMENVPEQAIKNNVVGTLNLCKLAAEFKVQRFLLISTDKAVNPTNVMGASKRCCEMIVKYHAQTCPDTIFCAVRFGNVLGSNGSVIPLFRRQILAGGPVTLTDKDIIRYFMTIPEAVSLVLETSALSQSGEIFVLDMGEPVRILDLAENMIRLSGHVPYQDIDIVFTGLRPGEKLFEELLIRGEDMRTTPNKKIFICKQIDVNETEFPQKLDSLINVAKENKPEEVVAQLKALIPTYHRPEELNEKASAEEQKSESK